MSEFEKTIIVLAILVTALIGLVTYTDEDRSRVYNASVGDCLIIDPVKVSDTDYVYRVFGTQGSRLVYLEQRRWVDTYHLGWYSRRAVDRTVLKHVYLLYDCPSEEGN